jgi:predicted secreted protein
MAAACSSSEAAASTPVSARDKNKWNQRRMIKVAKIHHKNHVFSMKEITEPLHGCR